MSKHEHTRRTFCAAATAAAAMGGSARLAKSASVAVADPSALIAAEPLQQFMRVFASTRAEEVWYAYGGFIEIAAPDQSILPLCGIQTLIRRSVRPIRTAGSTAIDEFVVTTWEANYYHELDDLAPRVELINPATGARVQPVHFFEGRRDTPYTAERMKPFAANGLDSRIVWRTAGDYTWLRRQLHVDVAHPLDPAQWPLESSGTRNRSGSFSTHCAQNRDLQQSRLANVPCSFNYQAIFGWLPWMMMGQQPGHLVWRADGQKLPSIDALDPQVRRGFEAVRPAMFAKGEPWTDSTSLWDEYRRQRSPSRN